MKTYNYIDLQVLILEEEKSKLEALINFYKSIIIVK